MAASSVCQAKVAHLTRIGKCRTPASAKSLPRRAGSGSTSVVTRARKAAASLFASYHTAGKDLFLVCREKGVRAHLSEVQIDCIARQGKVVLVLGRDAGDE